MLYKKISIGNHYLRLHNETPKQITLGGNQGWWKEKNNVLSDFGCGVIAMCDLECYLYRRNSKADMTREQYVAYVEKRFCQEYHFSELPVLKKLGLVPYPMCKGLKRFYFAQWQERKKIKWAKEKKEEAVVYEIDRMLKEDLPVVASYDCTLKGELLPFYVYDVPRGELKEIGKMQSHYFTILGIWSNQEKKNTYNIEEMLIWIQKNALKENKKTEDGFDDEQYYLEIATYGMRCFIPLDMWLKQLGHFTNVLTIGTEK